MLFKYLFFLSLLGLVRGTSLSQLADHNVPILLYDSSSNKTKELCVALDDPMVKDISRCRLYDRVLNRLNFNAEKIPKEILTIIKSFLIHLSIVTTKAISCQLEPKVLSVRDNSIEYADPKIFIQYSDPDTEQTAQNKVFRLDYIPNRVDIEQMVLDQRSTLFKYKNKKLQVELWAKASNKELEWPLQLFYTKSIRVRDNGVPWDDVPKHSTQDFNRTDLPFINHTFFNPNNPLWSHMIKNEYDESKPVQTFPSDDLIISMLNRFAHVCKNYFYTNKDLSVVFARGKGTTEYWCSGIEKLYQDQLISSCENSLKCIMPSGTRLMIQFLLEA